jgi:hypothetical protein
MAVEQIAAEAIARNLPRLLAERGMDWWDLCRGADRGWVEANRISPWSQARLKAGTDKVGAPVLRKVARRLQERPVDPILSALFETSPAATPSDGSS